MRINPGLIFRRRLRPSRTNFSSTPAVSSTHDDATPDDADLEDVPEFETDDDGVKYLSLILGRQLLPKVGSVPTPVVEIQPGPGRLTRHLLEQHPRLNIRAVCQSGPVNDPYEDMSDLDRLCADFPDRFTQCQADFWSAVLRDEMDNREMALTKTFYGEEEALKLNTSPRSFVPAFEKEYPSHEERISRDSVTIFGVIPKNSIGRVVDCFIDAAMDPEFSRLGSYIGSNVFCFLAPSNQCPIDAAFTVYGRIPKIGSKKHGDNLVLVTSKRFVGRGGPQLRQRTTLFNCFYDVTIHAAICPYLMQHLHPSARINKTKVGPYLLLRWTPKKEEDISVAPQHRRCFSLFVNTLNGETDKRVIPAVEKLLPDVGPSLIMDGGFTMAEMVKDLSHERTVSLFHIMTKSPLWTQSIFGMVERGQIHSDEWMKKRLKIKKGFIKASYDD